MIGGLIIVVFIWSTVIHMTLGLFAFTRIRIGSRILKTNLISRNFMKINSCPTNNIAQTQIPNQDFRPLIEPSKLDWYLENHVLDGINGNLVSSMTGCTSSTKLALTSFSDDDDDSEVSVCYLREAVGNFKIPKKCIYIRKFYPNLLAELRKVNRSILIGSTGTGKSMFLDYYLSRLCNVGTLGELPPDHEGRAAPPEVVIYQRGFQETMVLFVRLQLVHRMNEVSTAVFDCFDPKSTVCIYEHGVEEVRLPVCTTDFGNIPTLLLMPDIPVLKYSGIDKDGGGTKFFMPFFTKSELLTIGKHMQEQSDFPKDLISLYSDDALQRRYRDLGGVIHHVCPSSQQAVDDAYSSQSQALEKGDAKTILFAKSFQGRTSQECLIKYDVPTSGEEAFLKGRHHPSTPHLQVISDKVLHWLEHKIFNTHMSYIYDELFEYEYLGQFLDITYKISLTDSVMYPHKIIGKRFKMWEFSENDISSKSYSGVADTDTDTGTGTGTKDSTAATTTPNWEDFRLRLNSFRNEVPVYSTMKLKTLYSPPLRDDLFIDHLFYKDVDGKLFILHITTSWGIYNEITRRMSRVITDKMAAAYYQKLQIDPTTPITYVYVPRSSWAGRTDFEYSGGFPINAEVWQLNHDFDK